ncbi:DNA polymerase III subunit gamma/tau [Sedimentibacter sp. MB31-C6]|uniref:DNA polymerase III subunit gamma/tau n=1 Tax=Sedimentibacter sp. MB31-C6 TaxID=3109366 RepID=UPI002DDD7D36|nr:DNA polymerase III subunit gamma/tau [Sedimentibacter sp. MB36-C1]WSI05273.1 DNA polymerase III subunit gamma/tau [Sedimentibacter sp. MB36-C1]
MSHQAIYRKFRPRIFDDVLGQEHVTKTLKNQIMTDNIAHAYLFSGIRGTGKTSTAKIFSRAVNCLNNEKGNPCNECEVCRSILDETNMDVIEMDAASNNGVDDIRELRDKVKFLPVSSRYKVYIIDEVHMLSKGAFNALLKTLEEPPEHLLFILATTEPHKIPATILSRCQRFDLKRIKSSVIVENMKNICKEINVDYEEKALKLIAANSEGAMRDALSILDRCVSFNEDKIDYDTVINLLGTVNYQVIIEVARAIMKKDVENTMVLVDDILNSGKELIYFLDELIIFFRNMLIIKTTESTDNLIRIPEDTALELKAESQKLSIDEIVYYIEELSSTQVECKRALNPKILLETRLIKMLKSVNYIDINDLLMRIEKLEMGVKNGSQSFVREEITHTPKQKQKTTTVKRKEEQPLKSNKESLKSVKKVSENKDDESIYNAIINGWQIILKKIRSENAGLQAIIRESKLIEVINSKAVFEFDPKFTFHINAANQPKNKLKFKEVLSDFLNVECEVEFILKTSEKNNKPKQTIEDIYEDLKNEFGEDKVEFNQED